MGGESGENEDRDPANDWLTFWSVATQGLDVVQWRNETIGLFIHENKLTGTQKYYEKHTVYTVTVYHRDEVYKPACMCAHVEFPSRRAGVCACAHVEYETTSMTNTRYKIL